MRTHRTAAGFRKWQVRVLVSAGLLALTVPLSAAPVRSKAPVKSQAGAVAPSQPSVTAPARTPSQPEFADAFPSGHLGALDLQLSKDEEKKAEAFVAFAQGLVAE